LPRSLVLLAFEHQSGSTLEGFGQGLLKVVSEEVVADTAFQLEVIA